jgi:hypothetical protein
VKVPAVFAQYEPGITHLMAVDQSFLEVWNDYQSVLGELERPLAPSDQQRDLRRLKAELEQDIHEALAQKRPLG